MEHSEREKEATTLIDPELLKGLTEEEKKEALAAAAAAKRAEERAEEREYQKALQRRQQERAKSRLPNSDNNNGASSTNGIISQQNNNNNEIGGGRILFVRKKDRKGESSLKEQELLDKKKQQEEKKKAQKQQQQHPQTIQKSAWTLAQKRAIEQAYLGKTAEDEENYKAQQERKKNNRHRKKNNSKRFEWDDSEDTTAAPPPSKSSSSSKQQQQYHDPIYQDMISLRHSTMKTKRRRLQDMPSNTLSMQSVMTKPLHLMTNRDWRILRENYDIVVKGGKTPPPMRFFHESPLPQQIPNLHPSLIKAIQQVFKFKEPSPIQRQAIPIGLQRRDMIGIAETGSGKTLAFGLALVHFVLGLSSNILGRVSEEGPLALVLAPTRELALQIDKEFQKLLTFQPSIISTAIVGGQSIQKQAQILRNGVHVVVGTPGRLNDCLEMAYLVLNQCCYIVLDEADRMMDMGFAPQMESILDAMGSLLKSQDADETYQQEAQDLQIMSTLSKYRVTALFSATMPTLVEQMAFKYLRHPAIVSIGDPDSRKNARIQQRIIFLSSAKQKEGALGNLLLNTNGPQKIIVFVNEKKQADFVGKMADRILGNSRKHGYVVVVLHGGKSQDERLENLNQFRRHSGLSIMVATDVAGRGLDIPNVSHVINFDLPPRGAIDGYTHRIGRTGRAGREGLATSLLVPSTDAQIMEPLERYLKSTGHAVPEPLARAVRGQGESSYIT